MTEYQLLMQEESHELSPDEVQTLSEPWEESNDSDQDIINEVLEVLQ